MSIEDRNSIEAVGGNYDASMMLQVRKKTRRAIHDIAAGVRPGMLEDEALEHAQRVLRRAGMQCGWHGIQLRFGPNTMKEFGRLSEPGIVLGNNDIFFVDIGPLWRKWEGDGGETFVVGNDPDMLRAQHDVRALFDWARGKWRAESLTGVALYSYVNAQAARMGWRLDPGLTGHRLGDFPHAEIYRGSLAEFPWTPSPGLWVLEIQIRHPERPISAFFEDTLLDDATA
jgi:Xaa-Pro aminopeptidase